MLLIALTLIMLKLGFLLLLVAGPFFLIIGTHPGFGRVIAIRWFEMIVGVLMKQVAVAIVLSVLLYCYSLIMSTTDTALPWALKILMIALVTVAVFIYRKPFQHLFSSVGYGVIGSEERAEYSWREASFGFRRASATAAGVAIPSVAAYRAARWARRHPATTAAAGAAGPPGASAMAGTPGEEAAAGTARPLAPPGADGHVTGRLRPEGPSSPTGDDDDRAAPAGPVAPAEAAGADSGRRPGAAPAGRHRRYRCRPPGGRPHREGASAGWARGSSARSTTSGRSAGSAPASGPAGNGNRSDPPPGLADNGHRSAQAPGPAQPPGPPGGSGDASGGGRRPRRRGSGKVPAGGNRQAGGGSWQRLRRHVRPPRRSGWFGAGSTVRSGDIEGAGAAGKRSPRPFWLRPVRRDK